MSDRIDLIEKRRKEAHSCHFGNDDTPVETDRKRAAWSRYHHSLQAAYEAGELVSSAAAAEAQEPLLRNVEPDDGCWVSCSGCHETNEGYETGHYAYSPVFKCYVGCGCSECGGLGVVWDNTDYSALGDYLAAEMGLRD
ncbi:hypothetical protein [Salipiger thiooxidans]|uniref:hypothetical protein n=1 Tax=Salipiger thiooxidans TaxID=282683 RepID=UPI001CD3483A|nr:hypothetical protein [Salipiger thiooxidans]MCA0851210.1 hypothetical protein [Salipiger thiooxidans]